MFESMFKRGRFEIVETSSDLTSLRRGRFEIQTTFLQPERVESKPMPIPLQPSPQHQIFRRGRFEIQILDPLIASPKQFRRGRFEIFKLD
jgi:hypothetical protein